MGMQAPTADLIMNPAEGSGAGLGKETYASFLLLAIAGFTLAGYLGLALFFVGALR